MTSDKTIESLVDQTIRLAEKLKELFYILSQQQLQINLLNEKVDKLQEKIEK